MNVRANITTFLLKGKVASQKALLLEDREYTYGEIAELVENGARWLVTMGHRKGDRIVLLAENTLFWVIAYLSTLRAGMVSVPLPTTCTESDFQSIVASTEPARVLLEARHVEKFRRLLAHLPMTADHQFPSSCTTVDRAGFASTHEDDLAVLMFTSGSTGRPRGVMVSHGNIIANTDSIIAMLGLSTRDRIMAVLPFHYCFGASLLHTHFRIGASIVADRRFMFPEAVLQRMRETECTGFAGVPSHYQILLRKTSIRKTPLPHLRYLQQAGGHLAPAFVRELQAALPGRLIFIMYGQTEATARLTTLSPNMLSSKLGSIGVPIPGVRLRLIDSSGEEVPIGSVGEIVADGKNVTQGYWRQQSETAETFRDGWLHTGDLAKVDNDGFFYLVGRAKDFLKCGGQRISSQQLEDTLLEHGALLEAAVVGIPDDILGEAVKAFVVPREHAGADLEAQLHAFCRRRLPQPFRPKEVIILSSLPKSDTGKIMKSGLQGSR
jgi:acyl-CoA synthetase (AMP-forming)/AMP-acid ligase II